MAPTTDEVIKAVLIRNIVQGQVYELRVRAGNRKHWSDFTEPISVLAAQRPEAPAAPIASYDASSLQLSFTWEEPSSGGSPITAYTLYIKDKQGDFTKVECADETALICEVDAMTLIQDPFGYVFGDSVTAKVSARNAYSESELSEASLPIQILTVPSSPTGLSQTDMTMTSLSFTFDAPAETGGSPIISFRVNQATLEETPVYSVIAADLLSPEFKAENLTPKQTYLFTLEAKNAQGFSQPSEPFEVYFNPPLPPLPPQNLQNDPAVTTDA